ncbi:MAG: glucosaminidase domain-containing protein [Ruminococcus sp.]|nr:glucosaminidase domain-containing protein [Ruminococcus sp.]
MLKKGIAFLLSAVIGIGAFAYSDYKKPPSVETYAITQEQQDFIEQLGSAAQKTYAQYGILPSMTVAQAILESGWGKSSLSALYYNFFGMKADSSYSGESVVLRTGEEVDGVMITVNGTFRVYHSFEEGIEGYYQFITGYERYSNLIGETDYKEACRKIKEDGWATASNYAEYLISLIESFNLTRFDVIPDDDNYIEDIYGDINGDGVVSAEDAEMMNGFLLGQIEFDDVQRETADINFDGRIDSFDVTKIRRLILNNS